MCAQIFYYILNLQKSVNYKKIYFSWSQIDGDRRRTNNETEKLQSRSREEGGMDHRIYKEIPQVGGPRELGKLLTNQFQLMKFPLAMVWTMDKYIWYPTLVDKLINFTKAEPLFGT